MSSLPAHATFDAPISYNDHRYSESYVSERCGGLMLASISLAEEGSQVYSMLLNGSVFFFVLSKQIYEEKFGMGGRDAEKKFIQTVEEFAKEYLGNINGSYMNSGEYFRDSVVLSDMEYCRNIMNGR
jgi:hypothetical protein